MGLLDDDDRDRKRTLGIRDRYTLWRNAGKRCENPACRRRLDPDQMQIGHRKAWSKGGRTTLANSVCLCGPCNTRQGRDSWAVFLRKQGVKDEKSEQKARLKNSLEALSLQQLRSLAKSHHVKVKGRTVEDFLFGDERKAPTKRQYVSKLRQVVTEDEIESAPRSVVPVRKRKKRRSVSIWDW
jgi:hypothetical protein